MSGQRIDVSEHFYDDNPKVGHPDVRTGLQDAEYFFLGNGLIQVALQWAPAGEGTPLGLLIMDPDRLRRKREALTMDEVRGVGATMLRLSCDGIDATPLAGAVDVRWVKNAPLPTVIARWKGAALRVEEEFSCPDWRRPVLVRHVVVRNPRRRAVALQLETGVKETTIGRRLRIPAGGRAAVTIEYQLRPKTARVTCGFARRRAPDAATRRFWSRIATVSFGHPLLDHFFRASMAQMPVAVSRRGVTDGSIWQYNREWLRDQALIALALTMGGAHELAATMFRRFLDRFVTDEGDTVDASVRRAPPEVELDQNGILLYTLKEHVLWTGNVRLVRTHWKKIVAAAEFPLRPIFRHEPSGLLMNRRDFWERHDVHGVETGLEFAHQFYAVHGLSAAAVLARLTGHDDLATRWDGESARLRTAMLEDPRFRMWDERGFVKRRSPEGLVQECIVATPEAGLPPEVPLARPGEHFLNPDTSTALPIVLGIVPPDSPLCAPTLANLETLWNQDWKGGGYGRYHVSSEPDSPGAWPAPSLFIARAAVETGDDRLAWRVLNWLGRAPGAQAGTWLEFYGRRLAPPFPQVGVLVWNWAEIVMLLVHHVLGVRPGVEGVLMRPRLLSGIDAVRADLLVRGRRLKLRVARTGRSGRKKTSIATGRPIVRRGEGSVVVAY